MVDEGRIARLLRGIEERVARLEQQRTSGAEARRDPMWLDGIKYLFVTAIEACVDVAHHLAASERWEAPDTNAAALAVLGRHGVLEPALAERMSLAVGFRNLLVHQYATVDDDRVVAALDELDDLTSFASQVAAWVLTADGGSPSRSRQQQGVVEGGDDQLGAEAGRDDQDRSG